MLDSKIGICKQSCSRTGPQRPPSHQFCQSPTAATAATSTEVSSSAERRRPLAPLVDDVWSGVDEEELVVTTTEGAGRSALAATAAVGAAAGLAAAAREGAAAGLEAGVAASLVVAAGDGVVGLGLLVVVGLGLLGAGEPTPVPGPVTIVPLPQLDG